MQKRFSIGLFTTFGDALAEKTKLLVENPDNTYQIRRRVTGGKVTSPIPRRDTFDLLQRVTASEADQVIHRAQALKKGKKKRVKNYQRPV
jgi:hypothetical protein